MLVLSATSANAQALYSFSLPAQPLETSLRAVASQTNTNVVFASDLVRGKTAVALQGDYPAQAAYEAVLRGSGLRLAVTDGGSFIVSGPGQSAGQAQGQGALVGRVSAASGARGLDGALVRLETGQTAVVDSYGNFRFSSLPAGTHTVAISFLGFETLITPVDIPAGETISQNFALNETMTGTVDDVMVFGSRSARANALNLQRTAENSADVISADDLGNFTGTTFSEALRRAPGISFQRDSVTGDGTNVIVRGLEPDMNAIKLNGVNLPVGNGVGRSADLSNLLADSISRITINKSLLPSQDSSGTGGLIEIETMSPLDRPHRYSNFLIEGGRAPRDFNEDFLTSGTVAGTFGDTFGLSASVQYRKKSTRSISYDAGSNGGALSFGRYLPLDAEGDPITTLEAIDPLLTFPFIDGEDEAFPRGVVTNFYHNDTETLAATLSAEWQIASHTNLKFDIQHSQSTTDFFALSDTFSTGAEYEVVPGQGANAQLVLDLTPGNAGISRSQGYSYDRDVEKITDTYSLNGKTTLGAFEFKYLAGYAHGTETHPGSFTTQLRMPDTDASAALFLPEAIDSQTGLIATGFAPRSGSGIPLPLLSAAGWAVVNDPSAFTIDNASGQIDRTEGSNDRYTASGSARWTRGEGWLNYVEVGAFYESTEFRSDLVRSQLGGNIPVSALGFDFVPSDLSRIGMTGAGFSTLSESTLRGFVDNLDQIAGGPTGLTLTPIVPHPDQGNEKTEEENFAAYLQARLDIGKLEVIGGLRYNHTKLTATNLSFPVYIGPILPANGGGVGVDLAFQNEFTKLVTEETTAEDILPRVLFNYRANDDLILRGGYFLSVARPSIGQLSSETRVSFINFPIPGPEGVKPILQINSGNPNLKPATTDNFDLSAEYYSGVGIFKVSAFYKRIDNLLQTNITNGPAVLEAVTLPDHPYFNGAPYFDPANPGAVFINGGSPVNSDEVAELWGIEAQAERRFDFLPGIWGGFGVFVNHTWTKSSRADRYNWAYDPVPDNVYTFSDLPFVQQPEHSGTAAITYNKYDIDATLTYGYQSRAVASFQPRGLSVYTEGAETLDFRAEYYMRPSFGSVRVYVEANDLLNGTGDPDVQQTFGGEDGAPKFYTQGTYLGGRSLKIGLSATF